MILKDWIIKKLGGFTKIEFDFQKQKVEFDFREDLRKIRVIIQPDFVNNVNEAELLKEKAEFIDWICDKLNLERIWYP